MTYMPRFLGSTTHNNHAGSIDPEAELLKERSRQNLSRLLTELELAAPAAVYQTRLEAELEILEDKAFCGYFLIVADYVQWARENGIAVGPGRGSGPCSLVGFAMRITNIDPIKYALPFERFVNPHRDSLPDFDLDFCGERYAEVSSYIQSKYGTDRVAQISSEDTTPLTTRLVIGDRPLAELVALYANPESGFPAAKMTLKQIADAGLVPFNVINQEALTVIQRSVLEIAKSGTAIEIDKIALDDQGAYHLLSAGEASSITILDGENYKNTLKAIQPDRFEHLSVVIALSQPYLHSVIPRFVERRQNAEQTKPYHPALLSITADTGGLILYQEQVMRIAHDIAGFSFAQAESFRRALKNANSAAIANYRLAFIDGALKFGLSQPEAAGLFEHIEMSGKRYFNKSHAVAFALIAYQTAWLKANYPVEFATAVTTA